MKKRILIVIGLLLFLILLILVNGSDSIANNRRMVLISYEDDGNIYYDRQTKVEYWISDGYYNRGNIIVLVDKDGKPLLYKGEE